MCINHRAIGFFIFLLCISSAQASDEHGSSLFHAFTFEGDYGAGRDDTISHWDLDGWIGSDMNKLWLKSEGEVADGNTESSEIWALYSRNVATFWDTQVGLRYDSEEKSTSYFVMGMNGLAPYYFETEAHLFVSDDGDVSFRLRQENDFLITQKWIIEPFVEVNVFAQDVPDLDIGSGVSSAELGLQLRYEVTRKFAPYIELNYERLFGETASIARGNDERTSDLIGSLGLRLMF